ncbi:ATP-binding protein [Vibrio sp. S4M6]|uniref:tight adherence pilus pseudopilin TadF n=1 Tax=Vibrio sinus TaxID=2946865 RepID=UPI00202A047E|nr:ATP-binding protein [Vibrio sinus]
MINSHSKNRQSGIYAIEFALITTVICLILIFSFQAVASLSIKGQLERLSFSLVSILRERTQLYNGNYTLTQPEANALYTIAQNSLNRTLSGYDDSNFGAVIEGLTFDSSKPPVGTPTRFELGSYHCNVPRDIASYQNLSVVTTWGRQAPLYRVTLCYKGVNYFALLHAGNYRRVEASSYSIGR